ncbi:MAG: RNA-directed DNA polymerase, partial [Sphaerochaetaceae bacterium]|nr:RNA-directed DNA polymerase [Sphaerochaetaceae bacterium]
LLTKKIKCQKTLKLFYKIIDRADVLSPLGLPLGNATSQLSANIYLNELDQFCKRKLGIKYYVRYMDDFFIMCRNKAEANRTLALIEELVGCKLHLELNKDKTKLFPINQGVNAIGYKIYPTHMLLRNDSKKKIKRKTKAMPYLIRDGKLSITKAEQMLNSWKGHAEHANSYNFIKKLVEKNDFIYVKKKGKKATLKINVKKLEVVA